MLEGGRGVCQSKWHHKILKMAISGPEGCLPLIPILDAHQVVGSTEVNLGVHLGSPQPVKKRCDQGEGISVLLGDFIESSVVNTMAEGAILLLDKQDWGCSRGLRVPDEALGKVLIKVLTEGLELRFSQVVDGSKWRS